MYNLKFGISTYYLCQFISDLKILKFQSLYWVIGWFTFKVVERVFVYYNKFFVYLPFFNWYKIFLWYRNEAKLFVGSSVETSDSESGTFVGCGRAFVDMSKIKKSSNKKRRQALENSKYCQHPPISRNMVTKFYNIDIVGLKLDPLIISKQGCQHP